MAAEASRSGGMADSYIGSLISLTSKSEIRYEGILFNINTEEASIGLRNVRSFGTEGRRKDGPQVPPIDKVYEYIVFRGSDIKDLQVKSSPPVQTAPPASALHNDPAIIQSHYTQAPSTATSLPSAGTGPAADFGTQVSQPGIPRSTFPSSLPLYQPRGGGGMGWAMPMYWQGYYGPSSSLQSPQQSLMRPPQGLSLPPSLQQPAQYPIMNSSLPTGAPNLPTSQSSEFPPPLLPPFGSGSLNMPSTMLPHSSAPASDDSTNLMPTNVSQNASLPLVSPSLSNVLDKSAVSSLVSNQAKAGSSPLMPYNNVSELLSTVGGTSTSPSLVTPGQFLQPGPTTAPLAQPPQTAQKDVEVVQVPSTVSPSQALAVVATTSNETKAPLLPLPSPASSKLNGGPSHTHYINRGGRGRGRGPEFSRPMAKFTEDFDFEAMNEKFNKDEVWGHLGKSTAKDDGAEDFEDDGVELPKVQQPVYKKDDFFDSLSCNALDHELRNGRTRFSEQRRIDTETFGDFSRTWGYRGGRGPWRGGGRSRGGYYGRGYGGYVGRGRGYNVYRPI